jgi:signal transduction histidine kinase
LGLSIAYGIIEEHGGTIIVDSWPGEGSEFKIVLPLQRLEDSKIIALPITHA